ncbi:MAG TPA: MFS transporter [Phototrophicaceae bacterium]|nr:MFS transporter [Phototrophicaceae bacterium]
MSATSAAPTAKKSVHPLAVRDFRLLWIGGSISLLGDQFYMIALPWLVLQLTGSALALGTVLALGSIPRALFMVLGGAAVDRTSPRLIMFLSNFARMVLVALLAVIVLTNSIQLWMLYAIALALGTADAFFFPAENAIIPALLQSEQLEMGNTLMQGMNMLSMFIGPVIAGVVIALLAGATTNTTPSAEGIGIAFAFDSLSFVASLIGLSLIRQRKAQSASKKEDVITAIKAGVAFVWKSEVMRMIFVLLVAVNFFVTGPFGVGIPVLASRNFPEGAAAYGILMSAYGGGALLGIILAGVLPKPRPTRFGAVLLIVTSLLGVGMMVLPFSESTLVAALVSLAMGTTMGYVNIYMMTWLQRRVPEALMGRVMSLIMFASMGIAPVSSAVAGVILNVNLELLFVGAGALMAVITLISLVMPPVRQMGLEVEELEKKQTIAEILRDTSELPALRSTGSMPAIRL